MTEPILLPGDVDVDGALHLDLPRKVVQALCRARFAAGARVELEIRPRKSKRSERANAALHAGLSGWGASKGLTGAVLREWVEDRKDDLLALCWGYVVRQNQLTGEVTQKLAKPHTARLTVEEFAELFDVALVEAAKDGYLWTLPEEIRAKRGRAA